MAFNVRTTEIGTLELWGVALENAEEQPGIAAKMAELSYDSEKIAEGKSLLAQTMQVYMKNKTEDVETSEASAKFKTDRELLEKTFRRHRRKARVVFRKDPVMLQRLAIDDDVPGAYAKLMETVSVFYSEAGKPDVLDKLARLGITGKDISGGMELASSVSDDRNNYLREVGESEAATKAKDAAMAAMQDWMTEFYAVARIALEDQPQLLEALGRPVKS
jgi:hypothetical protein